jgi:hypothetical protein
MARLTWMAGLAAFLLAGGAMAQDATDDETASDKTRSERTQIKVLADPYDLASFYRSGGSGHGFGAFGYDRDGSSYAADRYPISSYYRSTGGESFGYWRNQSWRRAPLRTARRRAAEQALRHRELYLLVPAFLVPVAPFAEEPSERAFEPAAR